MPGTTNFLQFNPSQANQENDAAYLVDTTRVGGAGVDAIWPSNSANKTLYQATTFVAAFAAALVNKGYSPSDASLSALTALLANVLTNADIPGGLLSVAWASSIALNAAAYGGFEIYLSGTSTTLSISGVTAGQIVALLFVQDATGSRTVTFPSNIVGASQPDPTPSYISAQLFKANSALALEPLGPNMSVSGINGTPIGAAEPSSGKFTTLTLSAGAPSGQVLTGNGTSFIAAPGPSAISPNFVTGSRAYGVQYQNTSGAPLTVNVTGELNVGGGAGSTVTMQALIGSSSASNIVDTCSVTNGSGFQTNHFVVPIGWYYRVNTGGIGPGDTTSATLTQWTEWSY